jgi:Uma2 family endonuclease
MPMVSIDPRQLANLIRDRRKSGGDRYDEVWDGVYVMSPLADNEHQSLAIKLGSIIEWAIGSNPDVLVFQGCNVSNRAKRWKRDYRCPDVAVFLPGNPAENCGTHWYGGPDFAVEIESPFDRSREKFDFYVKVGVGELLFVSRRPWTLELFRRAGKEWELIGKSEPDVQSALLQSAVLPLGFRLVPGAKRPQIEVIQAGTDVGWLA